MSSQDHDRLLEEGSTTSRAAARSAATREATSPRRTRTTVEDKAPARRSRTAPSSAPSPAARTSRDSTTRSTTTRAKAAATKAAVAKSGAAKEKATTATTKMTTTVTTKVTKAATEKVASTKPAAAKAPAAKAPAAKAAAAKAAAAKATAPASPAAPAPVAVPVAATSSTTRRPSPTKRPATTDVLVVAAAEPVRPEAPSPLRVVRRRLRAIPDARRRPAVLLAASLVGALSVGLFGGSSMAAASATGTQDHSVSVAHALGLSSQQKAVPDPTSTDQLRQLAASRAERAAAQTAAAQAQTAADQAAVEAARPKAVFPVPGGILTSGFGYRWGTLHAGIDLAAPLGTPEYAVMDGVVLKAGPASGFGLAVYIQHANGDVTVYGHMEKILVQTGQVVHAGDTISLLGAMGQATGPHLHLEVHVGGIEGQKIDPAPWLRERGVQI
jgi:murein DD-endopeptidase MepM/ murein hydrolase activator NlpD